MRLNFYNFSQYFVPLGFGQGQNCDIRELQSNTDLTVLTCINFTINKPSICVVECPSNYQPRPHGLSLCVSGSFTPIRCNLTPHIVQKCEENLVNIYSRLALSIIGLVEIHAN